MSFSDYKTISQVQMEYQIRYDDVNFVEKLNKRRWVLMKLTCTTAVCNNYLHGKPN